MTTTNDAAPAAIDHVIGDRGRLAIRLAAAEIRLAATDGDRVVVRTPSGKSLPDRVTIDMTDDGITIHEKDARGLAFIVDRRIVQLQIDVPRMAEVAIDTASGWLDAQGLTGEQRYRTVSGETRLLGGAGDIELNTVSGDATIELVDATSLGIKSVSGDVDVRGGRITTLRIGTTSGDIRVDSPLVGATDNTIETLSGDVEIATAAGLRVEARTVSGDMTSDLPHRSEGRMGRRTLIVGDGSIELGFRSISGDLRIRDGSGQRPASRPTVPFPPSAPEAPRPPALPALPNMPEMPRMPEMPTMPDLSNVAASADPGADPADDPIESERMTILKALEQGDLDVPTALDRLAALDAADRDQGEERADG